MNSAKKIQKTKNKKTKTQKHKNTKNKKTKKTTARKFLVLEPLLPRAPGKKIRRSGETPHSEKKKKWRQILNGQIWDQFRVSLGTIWEQFGATLGPLWGQFGGNLGYRKGEPLTPIRNCRGLCSVAMASTARGGCRLCAHAAMATSAQSPPPPYRRASWRS